MAAEGGRYRFPPLERRGLIAGISATQLVVAAAGCVAALITLSVVPAPAGQVLAVIVVVAAGVGACWHVAGRTPASWAPVAVSWLWRRRAEPAISDASQVGTTLAGPVRAVPPAALAGVHVSAAPDVAGSPPMGVVRDNKAGTMAAVLSVRGRSFSLLDPEEKHRRLEAWGAVLAGLCRDGSPVHRIQWLERATPGEREGLRRYLDESVAPGTDGAARESYAELISGAGPVGQAHASVVVLAIQLRKAARAARSFGRGHAAACAVLRREVRLLHGQLRQAELVVDGVLSADEVVAAFRSAFDPHASAAGGGTPWPMGVEEHWAHWRADGSWHRTYWIAEWPRIDVGPDFLSPLLLATSGCRAASVVLAPIPPARAAREVEAARTADLADEKLRQKAGFLTTARRQREAEGVIRRESELADGHAEFRFSGYVSASAPTLAELEVACAEIEQAARQSNLELRRLYGQQAEAFTWTMPLARGLR